jgi:valyl-tRNA synthetase
MSEFNNNNTNTNSNDNDNDCKEQQIFLHPETGEQISKNAYKKLMKGGPPKKEKKEKPIPVPKSDNSTKKEKKVKDPEQVFIDETPDGNKKIIDGIFPPTYQPKYVEAAWQSWWEKSKFYSPNRDDALNRPYEEKFIMVIPPPNVTGYTCIYCYSYSFLL